MENFKQVFKKTWVLVTAAALIAGSNTVMAFALNNNKTANTSANVAPITVSAAVNDQSNIDKAAAEAEYTVVDRSKRTISREELIGELKAKLSTSGWTQEQLEKECDRLIASMIPGEKDITAAQAAAYAADMLKKAYGLDLKGYTAEASFSKNPVPYYDNWGVMFRSPDEMNKTKPEAQIKTYYVSINSVDGTTLDAGFYTRDFRESTSKNVKDPAWLEKGKAAVSTVLPEGISIKSSKVIYATPLAGVMVVCDLSDGAAYAVRLSGDNKDAAAYIYFPHGYDGSLELKPVTENGVG